MVQQQPLLASIGIPTYNRAGGYLRLALRSALAQTYTPLEIIVSDNCSTDDTESVVQSFNDPRIRYFRQSKNLKPNDNFNFCLDQARGTYFLLLHDDDLIDPTFVQACMGAAAGRTEIGILRTGTRLIDKDGNTVGEDPNHAQGLSVDGFFRAWLTGRTALYLCSTMFNTQGLRDMGGFFSPVNLYQDVAAELKLAAASGRADVSEVLASFRRHDANRGDAARVMDWARDSHYLIDLMCTLAPDSSQEIRQLGCIAFLRRCYRRGALIGNPFRRWYTYWHLYRSFGHAVPPAFAIKRYDYAALKQRVKALIH